MSLLSYLYSHFIDESSLLNETRIDHAELHEYQQRRMMPMFSYKLTVKQACSSYFGEHEATEQLRFYSRGCVAWLRRVRHCANEGQAKELFTTDYQNTLVNMQQAGFQAFEAGCDVRLASHISQEWQHFLSGTYGVCTRNGLVEEIATKAIATHEVEGLIQCSPTETSPAQRHWLNQAITRLDEVTAAFAPHEVVRSSREQLINSVRVKYGIQID